MAAFTLAGENEGDVSRAAVTFSRLMETALKLKAGETVDRVTHPQERTFSDYDDLSALAPRGY